MISDEEAKAVQEVAKATPRILDSMDGVGRFFDEVLGYPIREAGGFLGDWVKFKRDNWRKTVEMSQEVLSQRDIGHIDPIPAKYAVDIIQRAALEDDELIQKMWAGLIANSLDPAVDVFPRKILISLLAELEPLDARFLTETSKLKSMDFRLSEVLGSMEMPLSDILLTIDNLCRLELLRNNAMYGFGGADGVTEDSPFSLTALSATLLSSVQMER
ncbi:Abi-alpha family protein [Mariprofundus ferrooxydans]|nr:Abi-alpha family protein [Mariprofundus ferrooxydans]